MKFSRFSLSSFFIALIISVFSTVSVAEEKAIEVTEKKNYNFSDPNQNQKFELGVIKTNQQYSSKIFDRQEYVTNKPLEILKDRQRGFIDNKSAYIGARFIGSHVWEKTNTAGKFPIISRIPDQHTSGKKADEEILNDLSANITINIDDVTLFAQGEYTDVEYPSQENAQMRKYYLMYGNLEKHPFYFIFGRKTISFGDFSSYAPITHNHSSHYFWAQSDKPVFEFGYYKDDLNIVASLIGNDRGLRVLNAPDSAGYENFALNVTKELDTWDNSRLKLGAGFLKGTIYDSALAHHPPSAGLNDKSWNGAWNVNATLSWRNFDFMAEFTRTVYEWPATNWEVSAFTYQSRYKTSILDKPTIFSFMFSRGEQGDDGTEWEQMMQTVLGTEVKLTPNVELGIEYLHNRGFVPLILPRFTGDRDVESHNAIASIQITF